MVDQQVVKDTFKKYQPKKVVNLAGSSWVRYSIRIQVHIYKRTLWVLGIFLRDVEKIILNILFMQVAVLFMEGTNPCHILKKIVLIIQ